MKVAAELKLGERMTQGEKDIVSIWYIISCIMYYMKMITDQYDGVENVWKKLAANFFSTDLKLGGNYDPVRKRHCQLIGVVVGGHFDDE